ncbi:hypothetical protein TIFTF001_030589 [Ficus carica]|uniref:Uncharacterized protein n=1 Tax=Ficus carica TaxID=3494 RepID=A0AA88DUF6_FICCA|nr:hypothetical protein TIFTF001_030589 [Ficus carica]
MRIWVCSPMGDNIEDEDLLGAWFFSGKFLLNGFVWLGLGGCSGLVVADDFICGVPLDMNLDGFSGDICATIDSLSIDPEFPSIVEELSKRILCVLDGDMSRYYPVFGYQTSIFLFVRYQNVPIVLIFVEGFIVIMLP